MSEKTKTLEFTGFRDSVPVCEFHACSKDTQNVRAKQAILVVVFKVKQYITVLKVNKKI